MTDWRRSPMNSQAYALPRRRVVWHRKTFLASIPSENHGDAPKIGIACGGVSTAYAKEALSILSTRQNRRLLWLVLPAVKAFRAIVSCKLSTSFPFPEVRVDEFLDGLDAVIVFEELDSVIEDGLVHMPACVRREARVLLGFLAVRRARCHDAGENDADDIVERLSKFFDEALLRREVCFRATSSCVKLKNAPMRASSCALKPRP